MTKPKGKTQRADTRRKKTTYRVSHWAEYNASLVQRGSITVWIEEEVLESWQPVVEGPRKRG